MEAGILFAIETGMRRGEILNVHLHDVDFEHGLLRIPESKADVPRAIPLTERAVEILKGLIGKTVD